MAGPRDSSLTAMAVTSIRGQSNSKATEDITKSKILLTSLPRAGIASHRRPALEIAPAQSPDAWVARSCRAVGRHSLSRTAQSEGKSNSGKPVGLGRGGKRKGNVGPACPVAFRLVTSEDLDTMRKRHPRSPLLTHSDIERSLRWGHLPPFDTGRSEARLERHHRSVDKVQSAFEMQENTLELFFLRDAQNSLIPAPALCRKEKTECRFREKHSGRARD